MEEGEVGSRGGTADATSEKVDICGRESAEAAVDWISVLKDRKLALAFTRYYKVDRVSVMHLFHREKTARRARNIFGPF